MKTWLCLFVGTLTFIIHSVQAQDVDLVTYENTQDLEWCSQHSIASDEATVYQTKDGSKITIGSPLMIGRPSTNSGGFTHILMGKLSVMGNQPLESSYQAEKVEITKIRLLHTKMSKKSIMYVMLYVTNSSISKTVANRTIDDYEKALIVGEIINPNAAMTREDAIKKLKESKDLLDLGMITQPKYDSIKAKLAPIITKGN